MKKCTDCGKTFPKIEFPFKSRVTGVRSGKCKVCHPAGRRANRQAHLSQELIRYAKRRAGKRGLAFDLDKYQEELRERVEKMVCEETGIPLTHAAKGVLGGCFDSPSFDRVDAKRGYVYDNIRVVSYWYNCAKGSWGKKKLLELAKILLQNAKGV